MPLHWYSGQVKASCWMTAQCLRSDAYATSRHPLETAYSCKQFSTCRTGTFRRGNLRSNSSSDSGSVRQFPLEQHVTCNEIVECLHDNPRSSTYSSFFRPQPERPVSSSSPPVTPPAISATHASSTIFRKIQWPVTVYLYASRSTRPRMPSRRQTFGVDPPPSERVRVRGCGTAIARTR